MRLTLIFLLLLLALLLAAVTARSEEKVYERGVLVALTSEPAPTYLDSNARIYTFTVDVGEFRYVGTQSLYVRVIPTEWVVNDTVQFRLGRDCFYLKRPKGGVLTVYIQSKERLQR